MKNYHIALLPGDGIGHEVCPEGVKVIQAAAELLGDYRMDFESFPWGCEYYLQHAEMMSSGALKILESFDAIYFGAVGFPTVPDHISLHGLLLPIRQGFEQYANVRPSLLMPGVPTPLKDKQPGEIDFISGAREYGRGIFRCGWTRPCRPAIGTGGRDIHLYPGRDRAGGPLCLPAGHEPPT